MSELLRLAPLKSDPRRSTFRDVPAGFDRPEINLSEIHTGRHFRSLVVHTSDRQVSNISAANVERFQRGDLADVAGLPHRGFQKLPGADHADVPAVRRLLLEEHIAKGDGKDRSHGRNAAAHSNGPTALPMAPAVISFVSQLPGAFAFRVILGVENCSGAILYGPVREQTHGFAPSTVAGHGASPHECADHLAATRRGCHGTSIDCDSEAM